mmetsp:Transcript_1669/g.5023  ORF Transcript_1669/g.5023 Transcript_1669/m.5023 type:complete len:362 (+) Transcript_1669:247-1332(+)
MKWGKALNSKVNKNPDWSPHYLNYKRMKKELKTLKENLDGATCIANTSLDMYGLECRNEKSVDKLVKSIPEEAVPFVNSLNREVANVQSFYDEVVRSFTKCLDEIETNRHASDAEDIGALRLYEMQKQVKVLEEFARANCISTSKILKKLDKYMDVSIRDVYLMEVLNAQPFVEDAGPTLRKLANRINTIMLASGGHGSSSGTENTPRAKSLGDSDTSSRRDLNNDMVSLDAVRYVSLCVPLRYTDGELEVMTVVQNERLPGLVKAHIEAGESSTQAAIREMEESAGVDVKVENKLGEYLSTTKKNTMYLAFVVKVLEELDEWSSDTAVRRKWLPIDEAISIMEDNTAIRVLRAVKENPPP